MSNAHYSDAAVSQLRALVGRIEGEIAGTPPTPALQEALRELVQVLALGPAPQLQTCPACHSVGMRAASRCGNCWAALPLLPPLAEGTQAGDA